MSSAMHFPDTVVAIVAPGGYAADPQAVFRATAKLESFGCRVRSFYDASAVHQRFGGTDEDRVRQVHAAAADPEVSIVIALRGGYGTSRILPFLDFAALATSGKLFVGHSDFTAFQLAMLSQQGSISFAGPMICDDFSRQDSSEFTLHHFWQCLRQPEYTVPFSADRNPVVDVSGILWGGNLTMLAHLAGTPYMSPIDGGILFIEDVNEHPYRVERLLLQMEYAGLLKQKAIVFGDFTGYRLNDYDNGYDFQGMLDYLQARLGIPLLQGLPFGHTRDKVTLAVGSQARLRCDGKNALLTMSGYPSLSRR